jgi:uncharacterized protein YlxW (UPF0749 family)
MNTTLLGIAAIVVVLALLVIQTFLLLKARQHVDALENELNQLRIAKAMDEREIQSLQEEVARLQAEVEQLQLELYRAEARQQ